jgi:beta-N-acetylhexosaminidase
MTLSTQPTALWVVAVLWLIATTACAGPQASHRAGWSREVLDSLTLRGRVAQMVVVPLGAPADSAAGKRLRHQVRDDSVGGVLVMGHQTWESLSLLDTLQRETAVPLLVAAEVSRGAGALVAEATEFPPVGVLSALADPHDLRAAGRNVAREGRILGIHLGIVSIPTRGGGGASLQLAERPDRTGDGIEAFLRGMNDEGLLTALQLFAAEPEAPAEPRRLRWDRARLDAIELRLLRRAAQAKLDAIVLAPVVLPALTGDTVPLPLSEVAISGLLRRDLGWDGLVVADVGAASVLTRVHGGAQAAVLAVAAGADLLIGVDDPAGVIDAIVAAVQAGQVPPSRIEAAATRILQAKARQRLYQPAAPRDTLRPPLRTAEAVRTAEALASRSLLYMARPDRPALLPIPAEGTVLVTTADGGTEPFAREVAEQVRGLRHLRIDRSADTAEINGRLRKAAIGANRLIIAERQDPSRPSLWASVRRATPEPRPPEMVVYFSSGAAPTPPPAEAVLLAWGTGVAAQRAAAKALTGETGLQPESPASIRWPAARVLRPVGAADVGMSEAALLQVDSLLRKAVADSVFPGAALAVGRRGGVVRLRGYGRLAREADAPEVSAETMYDIASLSKVVGTTAAVMALVDDGRLELDAPVQRYIPEWQTAQRAGETRNPYKERATIRHLLTHTSGLPAGMWLYGNAASPEDAVRRVIRVPLGMPPGTAAVYSDLGMILLAEVVRRVAGSPLDALLAERVYAPLGMSSTMYLPPLALHPQIAPSALTSEREFVLQGIVHDGNAFRLGGISGHAGLFSTAGDLAVFAQTLLNGGSYGFARVFTPQTVSTFVTRQPDAGQRALGWDTPAPRSSAGSYFSARAFGHTGYTGTSLWIDPEKDLFVVLLTNRTYDRASSELMLKLRQRVHDRIARAITDVPVRERPGAIPADPPRPSRRAPIRRQGRRGD